MDREIDDGIVRLLLRMRRFSAQASVNNPNLQHSDLPFFRLFWSCSSKVFALAEYLNKNPHEAAAVLQFERNTGTGLIRGRLDARETMTRQMTSGNSALFVSLEAMRTYATGPNHLLLWVVEEARRVGREMMRTVSSESPYARRFGIVARSLEDAGRLESIRIATTQMNTQRRPSSSAIIQAMRARTRLHQLAAEAYLSLLDIEQGDEAQIQEVLQENLLGPLKMWERFELFVAVAIGESFSRVLETPAQLYPSFGDSGLLVKIGHCHIYWQHRTEYFNQPAPEPSEQKVSDILALLGMGAGWDRPDVLVVDATSKQVIAIAEVKYFSAENNDGNSAVRDAMGQLVRYVRGYRSEDQYDDLLGHSLAVPIASDFAKNPKVAGAPWIFDLKSILSAELDHWSRALIASSSPLAFAPPLAA